MLFFIGTLEALQIIIIWTHYSMYFINSTLKKNFFYMFCLIFSLEQNVPLLFGSVLLVGLTDKMGCYNVTMLCLSTRWCSRHSSGNRLFCLEKFRSVVIFSPSSICRLCISNHFWASDICRSSPAAEAHVYLQWLLFHITGHTVWQDWLNSIVGGMKPVVSCCCEFPVILRWWHKTCEI